MKKIMLFVFLSILIISCKDKYTIEREQKEAALRHKRDSLNSTDVKLSFMDIRIGGNIDEIEKSVKQGKIRIDTCLNGVYIGTVSVPCIKDTITSYLDALMRIGTFNNKIASIELLFKDPDAFDFFKNTFNERYYDKDEEYIMSTPGFGSNDDNYTWTFKNQSVNVGKITYKDVREVIVGTDRQTGKNRWEPREVDIVGAISVEYLHTSLYEQLIKKKNKEKEIKDSIEKAKKDSANQTRKIKAEKAEKEYKRNI